MEHHIQRINILRVKNYLLLSRYLDLGRIQEAKQLQYIDKELLSLRHKMLGLSKRYIWRTRDDEKVRPLHAINDNRDKWTNTNFTKRYLSNVGGSVTLQEAGLLGSVIEHYSKTLGIYDRASKQIINKAKTIEEGSWQTKFNATVRLIE